MFNFKEKNKMYKTIHQGIQQEFSKQKITFSKMTNLEKNNNFFIKNKTLVYLNIT